MAVSTHLLPAPPPVTESEAALARWADDGGPAWEPPPDPRTGEWLRISAALSGRLPTIAGRNDVMVTCTPGTSSGAPAAFCDATAELEIDTACFTPLHPASINPDQVGDEERYPAAWGALIHEAAHAAHSRWQPPPSVRGTAAHQAAEVLEESRAEAAHLARRPGDRPYLRACIRTLVMDSLPTGGFDSNWQAATASGLLLARRDTGVLDPDETDALEQVVTTLLGPDTLATLQTIWTAAHATADTDATGMLEHGRAWCEAVGITPETHAPHFGNGTHSAGSEALEAAITAAIGEVTANEQAESQARAAAKAATATRARAKAEQAARHQQAAQIAEKVFAPGRSRPFIPRPGSSARGVRTPICGTRPPTGAEKAAAGQLARALRQAAYRERTAITTASAVPPGRLQMRAALARDAQRAAGATPTAQPWLAARRRHAPTPPLRVGIAVDISGSMGAATAPIASAAWILAKATALTDPDSAAATVAYDRALTAITAPGGAPTQVTELRAEGMGHRLAEATDALTAALDLATPGAGRLLVIASDGYYSDGEAARAADRITTLTRTGCAVLWLAFEDDPCPLPGATTVILSNPASAITAIAKAATTALAATH
ncbi:VWA domain-containing protein [Streptomyces boninensis]|uniref:VWA domain-containing protein n=1 Tax=Streptomyces boninensis TaxID=2039455 RepID=UPI003B20E76E